MYTSLHISSFERHRVVHYSIIALGRHQRPAHWLFHLVTLIIGDAQALAVHTPVEMRQSTGVSVYMCVCVYMCV